MNTLDALRNLDQIFQASLFASLASLSLATAAFLGSLTARYATFKRSELSKSVNDMIDANLSARRAALFAFFGFVASLLGALGFDAVSVNMSQRFEILDVCVTGAPFLGGVLLLGKAAEALLLDALRERE